MAAPSGCTREQATRAAAAALSTASASFAAPDAFMAGKSGDDIGLGKDLDMSDDDDEVTQDGAEEEAAASARSAAAGAQPAEQPAAIEVS